MHQPQFLAAVHRILRRWKPASRSGKRLRNLDGVAQHLIERQRAGPDARLQRLTLQVLHAEEVDGVLVADVV
jgi:hypothetical protein